MQEVAALGELPVPMFCAGGIATPADASLVMQLGAQAVFVGSGIFKSEQPEVMAKAIVEATTHYADAGDRRQGVAWARRRDAAAPRSTSSTSSSPTAAGSRLADEPVAPVGAEPGAVAERTAGRALERSEPSTSSDATVASERRRRDGGDAEMKAGVLALQGAFREHREVLDALGVDAVEVRTPEGLAGLDALVIPGGESTTMQRLLDDVGAARAARPTRSPTGSRCSAPAPGAIVLAREVLDGRPDQVPLGAIDIVDPPQRLRPPA